MSEANLARLVVSLEAKIDKYEKSLDSAEAKAAKSAGNIQKSLNGAENRFNTLFGHADPGKAIENIFSRSRLAVFEEGAAKIPLFGSAIEALGPAGLVAAGGLAAMFFAMEKSEKAVEWAANIAKVSKEVGVSTDFLQQFNFAAHQNEVDVGAADIALKNLNVSLGAVQGNLPRARQLAVVFADALHLTPDQLRGYKDVSELLPVIADRIKNAGSAAEQAAIARKLGIEVLLPMLRQGGAAFEDLTAKARDLGIVMDAGAIHKAEEAKKKLSELDDVMKARANISFAEFADTLIKIKEKFADAEKAGLSFLAAITGTTPKGDLYRFSLQKMEDPLQQLLGRGGHNSQLAAERLKASLQELMAAHPDQAGGAGGGKPIVPTAGKSKTDDTAQKIQSVNEAAAAAARQLLEAQKALTANVEARSEMERQIAQEELAQAVARLEKQKAELAADKSIKDPAVKRRLTAELDQAETAVREAEAAKEELINRQEIRSSEDEWLAAQTEIRGHLDTVAKIAASQATTAAKRLEIELQILDHDQEVARLAEKERLRREVEDGKITQSTANQILGASDDARAAQRQDTIHQAAGPLQQYARQVQDLTTLFQGDAVSAIQSFSDGLADALVNAKSFGDVVSNVFRQLIAQILSQTIQKSLASAALAVFGIPAFATGTNFAPGGLSLVGERGPELLNIPRGSQIIPNSGLANAVRGGGSTVVYQSFHLDGAVTTDALLAHIDMVSTQKAMGAVGAAKSETLKSLAAARTGRLGR